MTYAEYEPARDLEPFVANYWSFAVDPEAGSVEHWVPPDGCASLAFRRGSPMPVVLGPWTVPLERQFARIDHRDPQPTWLRGQSFGTHVHDCPQPHPLRR